MSVMAKETKGRKGEFSSKVSLISTSMIGVNRIEAAIANKNKTKNMTTRISPKTNPK